VLVSFFLGIILLLLLLQQLLKLGLLLERGMMQGNGRGRPFGCPSTEV
jgi:hypothetical protein